MNNDSLNVSDKFLQRLFIRTKYNNFRRALQIFQLLSEECLRPDHAFILLFFTIVNKDEKNLVTLPDTASMFYIQKAFCGLP